MAWCLEPKIHKGLQVEWLMTFTNSALLGSLLKTAYLCLFRMLGYRWVFDAAGGTVRRALAAFYADRARKAGSLPYFGDFTGAFNVLLDSNVDRHCDTLNDNLLWLHYAEGDHATGILFAQTCLFIVNGRLITVTVPANPGDVYYLAALHHYRRWLRDRGFPQSVHSATFHGDRFEVGTQPLQVQYAPRSDRRQTVPARTHGQ
jgi:hypothetical protein